MCLSNTYLIDRTEYLKTKLYLAEYLSGWVEWMLSKDLMAYSLGVMNNIGRQIVSEALWQGELNFVTSLTSF